MRKTDLPKRRTIAKFETLGDKAAGKVRPPGPKWEDDKFNAGERVGVFLLNDGREEVQLFARRRQLEAIREALEMAEVDEIVTDGWLELVYASDIETANGTAKGWEASYIPPDEVDAALPLGFGEAGF
jgi:hypothetical protein